MGEPILHVAHLRKAFGGLLVTDDVTLDIKAGELHALIGPNGAGKSTLINQITGSLQPDRGHIHFCGRDITSLPVHARAKLGFARSFQLTSILAEFSVQENVALAAQAHAGSSLRFFGNVAAEQDLNARALAALTEVGLAHRADIIAGHLSHGEKRALEIAMALAAEPKLLLLDEPMAGTGHEETEKLIAILQRLKGRIPILLVEHDMGAVFALADKISVLVYGRIIAHGTPEEIRTHPQVVAAYLGDEME